VVNSPCKFTPDPVYKDLINDIIKDKEEIAMAAALLQEISKDEHERARLRSRRMYETDMISNLLTAERRGEMKGIKKGKAEGIEKGKAEGRAEGKAEGIIQVAKTMKREGMDINIISQMTDLSENEILNL